jgi:Protein of unknown function DUF262/Protein of unknown function (DUF1524)
MMDSMPADVAEAPAAGIGKLLQDNYFIVPNHQRDYSWTEHEVGQMVDDLTDALSNDFKEYFLGLMVFMRSEKGQLVVLDGQQRLATVALLVAAIRNWLAQYTEYRDDSTNVQERFIGSREFGQKEITPKLTMNVANNQTFLNYVVASVPIADIEVTRDSLKPQDRNRRLLEAVAYAHVRVRQLVEKAGSAAAAAQYFFKLLQYLRDRASVVRLTVGSESAAFTIFETLNDRGLDLSPLDLVKNYLFSKGQDPMRMRDLEARWTQMMATLANVKPDKFLVAFWTSRHGRIRSTDLYDAFKRQYDDAEKAIQCSIDMVEASDQYASLGNRDAPVWAPFSVDARERVAALNILGGTPAHPVMLAALKKMGTPEVERLLHLLETVIVRYQVIGSGNTGRFETTCATAARIIYQGRVKTAREVYEQQLREVYPSDDEFKAAFRIKSGLPNQKAQYILRGVEKEARRQAKGVLAPELQTGILTVDQILPRGGGDEWADVIAADAEIVADCVERLGNLCLLTTVNTALGRSSFEAKKEVFAESQLETTRELADNASWDRKAIDYRQAHMAKLAAQAWRFQ